MRGLRYSPFLRFCTTISAGGQEKRFSSQVRHFPVQSDAAFCVELLRASIGVPVHRFGNLCKTFFDFLCANFYLLAGRTAEKCATSREKCIQVLGVIPE
jgi:hypothetical protein